MKQILVRFNSIDNIELNGILYTPEEFSERSIIHVHGLSGNYYQNGFLDNMALEYTKKGYNFLSFNNRGNGLISEFIDRKESPTYIRIGSSYENFEESILDIEGAIKYLSKLGSKEYILQGHSYGCNKVMNYYLNKKDSSIKKIILLAPCDVIGKLKLVLKGKYDTLYKRILKLKEEGSGRKLTFVDGLDGAFSTDTFLKGWTIGCKADIFKYNFKDFVNKDLLQIKIPIIIEIGMEDKFVLFLEKEKVDSFYKNNFTNYKIDYIKDANHSYLGKEKELLENILREL